MGDPRLATVTRRELKYRGVMLCFAWTSTEGGFLHLYNIAHC
jgi:hypothetical protein